MTPRAVLLLLVLWLITLGCTYKFATHNEANTIRASIVPTLEKTIKEHNKRAASGRQIEQKAASKAVRTEARFLKLDHEVFRYAQTHPVGDDCSIGDDGLRIWRAANGNTDLDAASLPDDGLRGASAAGQRQIARPTEQPRTGDKDVPPVPGSDQGAGAMAGEDR